MDVSGLHSSDWTELLSLAGMQLPHLYQLPKDIRALGGYGTESSLLTINLQNGESKVPSATFQNLLELVGESVSYPVSNYLLYLR